ncbi:HNH endonuclease [Pseudomonas sp. Hp2]|uniref:HNH endonuclease n=1 Tax=Pseudomonas sp. Hp2 TaxID=701189 RepID=UPI0011285D62|nr:HNH endonuclease signature motif containing protein [Pseudomonas sp. Hp2]
MHIPSFEQNRLYKRTSIHDEFGGNRQSGISPSRKAPAVFIFTGGSGEQHGYIDTWDASHQVFSYTGEGQVGNMTMDAGNAAIRDHVEHGRALHLFAIASDAEVRGELPNVQGRGYCRYVGEMQCAGVIEATGPDRNGAQRKIFQFQLVRVEALERTQRAQGTGLTEDPLPINGRNLKVLRDIAIQAATSVKNKAIDAKRTLFQRANQVVEYALARANGICEACQAAAPFLRANGSPYLEVHHIDRLSDGGLDAPHRVAAVCPTCHRRIHFGIDGIEINDALRLKIEHLELILAEQLT